MAAKAEQQSHKPVMMTPRAKMITLMAAAAALLIGAVSLVTVRTRAAYTPIQDTVYSSRTTATWRGCPFWIARI